MFDRSFKDEFIFRHGSWPGSPDRARMAWSMEAMMDLAVERMEGYAEEVARLRAEFEEIKAGRDEAGLIQGFLDD